MRALGYCWLMVGGWSFTALGVIGLYQREWSSSRSAFALALLVVWMSEKFRTEEKYAEDAPMDEQYTETPWDK